MPAIYIDLTSVKTKIKKYESAARFFSGGKGFKMALSGSPDFRKQIDSIKLISNFKPQKKNRITYVFIEMGIKREYAMFVRDFKQDKVSETNYFSYSAIVRVNCLVFYAYVLLRVLYGLPHLHLASGNI